VFKDERLLDNVNARGAQLTNGLKALKAKYPIKEVRPLSLSLHLSLV
jgi:4-aminobutyrate aminotransferase-like enzyme